jgi:hypothetical protein
MPCDRHGQITVFDIVVTAGPGVAEDAVVDRRHAAIFRNALCHERQVYFIRGETGGCRCFRVGAGLVMTNQAVDVVRIGKVERRIFVAIANVALRAAAFVRCDRDAEIIEDVLLAVISALESLDIGSDALPLEVTGIDDLVADRAVAIHAGFGAFVSMLRKVTLVRLLAFIRTACVGVAVKRIDHAVTVGVLIGQIAETVLVEIPAIYAVATVGTV